MTSGGKRPGAGKPKLPESQKRANLTFRVAPETVLICKELRAAGYQTGRLVDDLLLAFAEYAGIVESQNEDVPADL